MSFLNLGGGCGGCNKSHPKPQQVGVCEVCARTRGDYSYKPVEYCSTCKAWMCDSCRRNWFRRGWAAGQRIWKG